MIHTMVRPVKGFRWFGKNAGIKDQALDLGGIVSDVPCAAAAVFTKNLFVGAPIVVAREHLAQGQQVQAVIVNSKNSNVATGEAGIEDARCICRTAAESLNIEPRLVFSSSTGVIGRRLPLEKIQKALGSIADELSEEESSIENFAQSIMTTDLYPKWVSAKIGKITIVGIAKGAGMIEPNMATMLVYFVTDAHIPPECLQPILHRIVSKSFNRISVDGDMSTSDTVLLLSNGLAGPVNLEKFEQHLESMAIHLAKEVIRDGEGASKLIQVTVSGATNPEHALLVGKSIINSPLIKTAIAGADPNWGRFVMAIGKVIQYPVSLEKVKIFFGSGKIRYSLSVAQIENQTISLDSIAQVLKEKEVVIEVALGCGSASETVWGCDLTEEYLRINTDYTT